MKIAFVVSTPLHVINMLNIYNSFFKEESITVFIIKEFKNTLKYKEIIEKNNNNIKVEIVSSEWVEPSRFDKLKNIVTSKKRNDFYFEHLFLSGTQYFGQVLYKNIRYCNPNVILNYFEDGMAVYGGTHEFKLSGKSDKLDRLLHKKNAFSNAIWSNAYVYEPDLIFDKFSQTVIRIPKIENNSIVYKDLIDIFYNVYPETTEQILETTIIYIDQPFSLKHSGIDEVEMYYSLKNKIKDLDIPIKVKKHPREKNYKKYGDVDYLETELPWEIFLLTNIKPEKIITATLSSTAAFTSNLMFGIDNRISLLLMELYRNEILKRDGNNYNSTIEKHIHMINFFSEDKENIKRPSSFNELRQTLSQL